MNFLQKSVNYRFITYSDSQACKNRGLQKIQISTIRRVYSQITAMQVISSVA